MREQELPEDLVEVLREREQSRPWEEFARQECDEAELNARLAAAGAEAEPRGLRQAAQPRGPEVWDRLATRVLVAAAAQRALPVQSSRRWLGWAAGGALVAAAAALLLLGLPFSETAPGEPGLPELSLELRGAVRTERGASTAAELPRLHPAGQLELVLRPQRSAQGPWEVRAFLAQGSALRPWPVAFERGSSGGFRLRGAVRELMNVEPGRWEIVLLVARPADLPDSPTQLAQALIEEQIPAGWRVLRQPILLGDAP